MAAISPVIPLMFSLTPGNCGDAPEGRRLLEKLGTQTETRFLLMDGAYEGNATRNLAKELNFIPVTPPNPNRLNPWKLDKVRYRRRNEIERLFRRIKSYRRIFTRYDKLDVIFTGFLYFALTVELLKINVNTP